MNARGVKSRFTLRNIPEARRKLALLKQALEPLAEDGDAPAPPVRLVERTLARIAEDVCSGVGVARPDELPHAPPVSRTTVPIGRSWWRRADLVVAACVLATVVGVGLIVLQQMRGPTSGAMIVQCKNNLREFYVALQKYREQNGAFPDVAKESPHDVAGMVVPILSDAGTLSSVASIRCPGIGTPLGCQTTLAGLRAMSDVDFDQRSPCLSMCYAYSLGYRDPAGALHGPGDSPQQSYSQTPIMADRPPAEGVLGNSINHGGEGQNVLFADGHVRFLPARTLGADNDIFLNRAGIVAAGLDAADIVLGYRRCEAEVADASVKV